ncbi:ribose ABC transport system, periplasmic ribose-binding protein RbsB [Klebsiella pneumoniae]|uniref:Ribose ABC transport system, periplasmic ribose-binding protein RbsB n=1 Tax=Klebsiella pneumoniae TaxID=573 RepID=A0A3S4HB55_KLEPN|nr:ribose ABC transport system, periplasmic ribose-binding protein RbsB [Klebsiella pneumoniae]
MTLVSSGYDLGQQVAQIDNFIAAKVDMIILNAADSKGIGPAVKRAKEAGIVVVAVDVAAEGADATITSDNTQAGELACKYISDRLNNKGNVVIINGRRSPPYKTASKAAKRSSKNTRTLKSSPPTRTPKAAGKAAWR